jgi:DNA-binding CsgD family transcriptional regulator
MIRFSAAIGQSWLAASAAQPSSLLTPAKPVPSDGRVVSRLPSICCALKYSMRDASTCAVGRRWLVTYWSRGALTNTLTHPYRIILFSAASFAALRLEQLIDHDPRWMGKRARVTPRELAVLRLVSTGRRTEEIAKLLELGEETVRSHLKKVQGKLGVRNRAQAVAEAIRQQLIPRPAYTVAMAQCRLLLIDAGSLCGRKPGEQAEQRQEGANPVDGGDARDVGKLAQQGRADRAEAEGRRKTARERIQRLVFWHQQKIPASRIYLAASA